MGLFYMKKFDQYVRHEEAAQQLVERILHQYIGVFVSLEQQIRARYGDEVLKQL